jgi:hypothetical protein
MERAPAVWILVSLLLIMIGHFLWAMVEWYVGLPVFVIGFGIATSVTLVEVTKDQPPKL